MSDIPGDDPRHKAKHFSQAELDALSERNKRSLLGTSALAPLKEREKETVVVAVFQRPPGEDKRIGDYFVRVKLRSGAYAMVGEICSLGDIETQGKSNSEIERAVWVMGGALAERQNEDKKIKARWDPAKIAKLTLECYRDLRAEMDKGGLVIETKPGLLDPNT